MSSAGWLLAAALLLLALVWVLRPLLRPDRRQSGDALLLQKQRERVLLVYERVLTNIRDLDEDHSTGKMPSADYAFERELWVQRGIQALRTLDELDAQRAVTASGDVETIDRAIDERIEAAVQAYRAREGSG